MYDLLVLGGGPAGYAAAIAAGRMGKKVALFEQRRVGGTCLNVGCIPTKYYLDKASLMHKISGLTEQGVFRDAGSFSFSRIVKGKDQVVETLTGGVAGLLKAHGVEQIAASGELAANDCIRAGGKEYRGRNILLCTGSEPSTPPIPGAAEHTVDSTGLLAVTKVPPRLVVIGGGVIGLELASAFHGFGSRVTVLEAMPDILPGEEAEVVRAMVAHLKKQGIALETGAQVTDIGGSDGEKTVTYTLEGQRQRVSADLILLATGRRACLSGVHPEQHGLTLNRDGSIAVDAQMRTNLPHVYAAGDVIGGWQLAHSAYAEAETAVHNMFCAPGGEKAARLEQMPRCVYTIPPVAAVGMTTKQAEQVGITVKTGRFPYRASGMALAEGETEGFALAVVDAATDRIIGLHIFGASAHELISAASIAVSQGMTVAQWESVIVPHPTLSEILEEAVMSAAGMARHIL